MKGKAKKPAVKHHAARTAVKSTARIAPAELKKDYDALIERLGQGAPVPQEALDAFVTKLATAPVMSLAQAEALKTERDLKKDYDTLVARLNQGGPVPHLELDALVTRLATSGPMSPEQVAALTAK